VEIPTLSNTQAVKIFACAGNATVTAFQGGARGAAYDNNYLAAFHMDETSGTILHDATVNANDAIKKTTSNPGPASSGQIGGAQRFVGTADNSNNDYALFTSLTPSTNTWTVEYWTNASSYIDVDSVFLGAQFMGFYWYPPGQVRYFNLQNNTVPTAANLASAGVFHYIVFIRSGDSAITYIDGVAGPVAAGFGTTPDQFRGLGWDGGASAYVNSFNGVLDEVSYSSIARSSDYVTARFNNLTSPSTFYTVSAFTVPTPIVPSTTRADSQVTIFVF
jgi:hypothetical protein